MKLDMARSLHCHRDDRWLHSVLRSTTIVNFRPSSVIFNGPFHGALGFFSLQAGHDPSGRQLLHMFMITWSTAAKNKIRHRSWELPESATGAGQPTSHGTASRQPPASKNSSQPRAGRSTGLNSAADRMPEHPIRQRGSRCSCRVDGRRRVCAALGDGVVCQRACSLVKPCGCASGRLLLRIANSQLRAR